MPGGGNLSSLEQLSMMLAWLVMLCCLHHPANADAAGPAAVTPSESYVGYKPSTGLGVILSAPHGGFLGPAEIPKRDAGCWNSDEKRCIWNHSCGTKNVTYCKAITVNDFCTQDLARELYAGLCELFRGACPAVVLNLLEREKFDANRDLEEATFMVPAVVEAFGRYHALIDEEKRKMGGSGLFIDIHGHGHKVQRAELGYLVRGNVLDSSATIDPNQTSIRSLAQRSQVNFDELLRGTESFGGFLGLYGFDSVPSPKYIGPGNLIYFNGGYNTRRHGSLHNGSFDAIQIESAFTHRESKVRPLYVKALACTIKRYYCKYYFDYSIVQHWTQGNALAAQVSDACATDVDSECSNKSSQLGYLNAVYLVMLSFLLFIH